MKRLFITLVLITVLISCKKDKVTEIFNSRLSKSQISKIDSICNSFIEKGNTIGLSLAIMHGDSIIYSRGFGLANIESKKPATDSTIYAVASVSKMISAIATMRFVERGKLTLSDKVKDYFEDFPEQEFMDEITIEHLLRHQSGIIDHEDWFDSIYINKRRVFTQKEFHEFIDKPLFFRPGTNHVYSNSGFAILSNILEKISNKPFHQVIQDEIGKPSGANTIGMWPELWDHPNASMSYELNEKDIDTSLHMMTKSMKGDGGLSASVKDLVKLIGALNNGKIISQKSLEELLEPTTVNGITANYGLGMRMGTYSGQSVWGHSGGYKGTGWANVSHYSESKYTFAAAMNTNYSPEEIWDLRHFVMPIVLNVKKPELKHKDIENIEQYVGEYHAFNRWGNKNSNRRIVYIKDGKLIWDNPDTEAEGYELYYLNKHQFAPKAYPFDVFQFHIKDGKVVAVSQHIDGQFGGIKMKK